MIKLASILFLRIIMPSLKVLATGTGIPGIRKLDQSVFEDDVSGHRVPIHQPSSNMFSNPSITH